jgi:hypothetical protein
VGLVADQLVDGDAQCTSDGLRDGQRWLRLAGLVPADLSAIDTDLRGQIGLGHAQFTTPLADDFVHIHVVHP